MTNCDIGSTPATSGRVTKPKVFNDKPMFVRMRPGVRERMDEMRGETRIGDFARELIEEALDAREREAKRKA